MAKTVDESTLRTIDNGRAVLGEILAVAQSQHQKVFIDFLRSFGSAMRAQYWYRQFRAITLIDGVHNVERAIDA